MNTEIRILNGNNGIGETELYKTLLYIESQMTPSMADNKENLFEFSKKIYKYASVMGIISSNNIVGIAAIYSNDIETKQAYLTYIALDSKMQSCGLGSILLEYCEQYVLKHYMTSVKLEVKNDNKQAMRFYIKHGYSVDSEATEHSIYMIKKIN